jgi:hypothetical protein
MTSQADDNADLLLLPRTEVPFNCPCRIIRAAFPDSVQNGLGIDKEREI